MAGFVLLNGPDTVKKVVWSRCQGKTDSVGYILLYLQELLAKDGKSKSTTRPETPTTPNFNKLFKISMFQNTDFIWRHLVCKNEAFFLITKEYFDAFIQKSFWNKHLQTSEIAAFGECTVNVQLVLIFRIIMACVIMIQGKVFLFQFARESGRGSPWHLWWRRSIMVE